MAVIYEYDSTQQELVPVYGSGSSASGGLTPEEHNALMTLVNYSLPIYDLNSSLSTNVSDSDCCAIKIVGGDSTHWGTSNRYNTIAVCGYKVLKVYIVASNTSAFEGRFTFSDGTTSQAISFTLNSWTEITIPDGAVKFNISYIGSSSNVLTYFALFANEEEEEEG